MNPGEWQRAEIGKRQRAGIGKLQRSGIGKMQRNENVRMRRNEIVGLIVILLQHDHCCEIVDAVLGEQVGRWVGIGQARE